MATTKFEIEASLRSDKGKGASRRLRRNEMVPGVVYGGGKDPAPLTIPHKELIKSLKNEAFYSHILTLKIDGEAEKVVLKDLQRHPFKSIVMHVDLQRVRADEKLYMNIPLHFLNEDKAPGVKEGGGSVSHIMSDVEVACFPDKLPEFIEVDLINMQLNETLHLSDLKVGEGIELVELAHGNDRPVVSIHVPRAEEPEEIPTEAPVATEVPAMAQKAENDKQEDK